MGNTALNVATATAAAGPTAWSSQKYRPGFATNAQRSIIRPPPPGAIIMAPAPAAPAAVKRAAMNSPTATATAPTAMATLAQNGISMPSILSKNRKPRARAFLTLVEKMAAEAFLIALEAFLAFSNNSAAAAMAAFPALSQAAGRALVASAAALLALSKKSEAALPAERHVAETVVATSIAAAMVALPAVWHVAEKAALAAAPMCAANSHARTPIPRHLGAITPVCYTFVLDRI
uniref:Uncharacterized protein n=3 Tax=Oryza TaxID=4527 RepID=Q75IX9_ORYSJ|nr:hypothetical protein [Oryza sativa Japonica Group]ABF96598.1 hypothetical protein LOC_Os03g30084 [Oryza sativa Japonica Group]